MHSHAQTSVSPIVPARTHWPGGRQIRRWTGSGALRAAQEAYRKAVADGSDPDRLRCDREFHLTLAETSGNQTLTQMLGQVFDRINLKRHIRALFPERGEKALAEHKTLLAALEARDLSRARAALQRHMKNNRESVLRRMREDTSSLRRIR